jgi:uncharacterized PurR-regulated membrane protein YhhQ (DUF165 family)
MLSPAASTPRNVPLTLSLAVIFIASAAASNWAIQHIGQSHGAQAPRTIPVGWGLDAASGVLLVGVMISVRDALHEQVGIKGTLLLIALGSAVSSLLAPPALAMASGATMLLAESADALVYQRLRQRGRVLAAMASNVVSSLLDSALFLLIAFGVAAAFQGSFALTIGKIEVSLLTLAALALAPKAARRFRRIGMSPTAADPPVGHVS